ncbi:sulfatase-like hydrolase/transferase [Roseomonas terrae]|uniref:Sulfatase-like hydrolase/transferase n=1 Tax=Neoroseomonas terrae TaxID=424799 RepID=A0ABS5EPR8_9PROT|nr:sulfatase-like hydrolase/transferase [Neoroseomonas terrae]
MSDALHLLAGAAVPLPFWAWLRRGAGSRLSPWALLDLAPVAALFLVLLAATARPIMAGGFAAGLCLFLAIADRAKRATLGEPLTFTDGGLLWQVAAHPRFYLPFVPMTVIVGGIGSGAIAFALVLALEPPIVIGAGGRLALATASAGLVALLLRPLVLLRGVEPARDPSQDTARFGPMATFALHARIAAVERPGRRAAHPPRPAIASRAAELPHLLLLQLESFCDPRRLGVPAALTQWDALAAGAVAHGPLAVPGFGANTMRTEFAVLTGLADGVLGLDRLNPYFRFARAPVSSIAWALRGAGYTTTCLHPFDERFFGRDRVLPALGFQRFEAGSAFADAPRNSGLVTDAAVAARLTDELAAASGPALLYAITVAGHGPWPGPDPAASWAARMAATDAMVGTLAAGARQSSRPVVLAAFGDHRPALPAARGGTDTDYLVWRSDRLGKGGKRPLDPASLHRLVVGTVLGSS